MTLGVSQGRPSYMSDSLVLETRMSRPESLKDSFVDGLLGVLFLGAFMPRMFLCVLLGGLIFLSFGAIIPFLILMMPVVASIYLIQLWMEDIEQSERVRRW
jgi:hypothetical protein